MDSSSPSVGQIAITARSVEALLPFYRDVLGLQFLFSAGPNLAFLMAGPLRLMLSASEGESGARPGANSVLYFKVSAVEATQAAMVERGAAQEQAPHFVAKMPDHELWIGFLRDPERNLVGLMEEKPLS